MRLLRLLGTRSYAGGRMLCSAVVFIYAATMGAAQSTPWDKPTAQIAHEIAETLGPAPAHLSIENLSSVPGDAVATIRRLLEESLKADGVSVTKGESANSIRVTLSEDARGGLWVAEVMQGNETKVVMTPAELEPQPGPPATQKVMLHRDVLARSSEMQWKAAQQGERATPELMAAADIHGDLIVLAPDRISVFQPSSTGWMESSHAEFGIAHGTSRDPRGTIVPSPDGKGFAAYAPGVECTGTIDTAAAPAEAGAWSLKCHASDDPWPAVQTGLDTWIKAFYNPGRDYFTGVITPATGTDLPPFYSAASLPRREGSAAVLLGGVGGQVQIIEGNQAKSVGGTRDWGSDFAVVSAGCGSGPQVIVSSSGEGATDGLRAYEIPVQEAVAVSDPLALAGTAMAVWQAPDGKSALAIVRTQMEQGRRFDYEVDRVTETCN